MPLRDLKGYLWDVREACKLIRAFAQNKTLEEYQADAYFRSAVERQLTILGEALAQARQHFPQVEGQIRDLKQIVGFRNRLIHAYLEVEDEIVWAIVVDNVPKLAEDAQAGLDALELDED